MTVRGHQGKIASVNGRLTFNLTSMTMRTRGALTVTASVMLLGACAVGSRIGDLFKDRPPHELRQFDITSDARIDSAGGLRGSFVGEGTSRAVHLVSSDTGFVAALVRRYRPDIIQTGDFWASLARAGNVTIDPTRINTGGGRYLPMVASPEGHTDVQLSGVIARGGACGWRGAQAELIVQAPAAGAGVPSLRGPVVGSFRLASEVSGRQIRSAPRAPSSELIDALIERTDDAMDRSIENRLASSERPLKPVDAEPLPINSLIDVDAADILPIHALNGSTRYAVSLRRRRITASGDTVVTATVMVWDSTGAWQQTVFAPTLLDFKRGRILPHQGDWTPVYWRRLQAVSGFEYRRDYIWMEQVHPMDGSVLWGIIDPSGNVVVAAAEMQGPCTR